MISMEMKSRIDAAESFLAKQFSEIFVGSRKCFRLEDGKVIAVDYMGAYNALVLEYAQDLSAAELNQFEDGDLFYIDELDEKAMLDRMLSEIQQ